jgi:N-acetylglucosamine-6-sulfatase
MNNFTEFPTDLPSFPRRLHDAGYATAYIGKWHMGEDNDERRPGFDYFVTHKGQGKYFDTEWNLDGKERKVLPGYYTHIVQKLGLDWLAQQKQDKPWLLMIGEKAPHSFYFPEKKYEHAFDDVRVPYPDSAFHLDDKPAWIKERLYTWHGIYGPLFEWRKKFPDDRPEAVKDFESMTHAYLATILSVDDSVGQMVATLRERGELDNTLIVFMGDNGLLNGEDGMVDKRTMHEPSIRVPRVVEQQVLALDVAPSILELCGAPALPNIHGQSFVSLARGEAGDWRKSWFYEYNYEKQFPYTPNVRGVRTDDWKYIHYPHGDGGSDRHLAELYDLKTDPQELRNLIKDPAQASKIAELQGELARLLKATGVEKDEMPLDEGIKQALPDQKIR